MKRTCWVWCPKCRRDLNGDDDSYVGEDNNAVVTYNCATCGHTSRFLFDAPTPILLRDVSAPAAASTEGAA